MKSKNCKKKLILGLVICMVLSSSFSVIGSQIKTKKIDDGSKSIQNTDFFYTSEPQTVTVEFSFSDPVLKNHDDYVCIHVDEADFNHIADGVPVLPVKLSMHELPFGTEIIDVEYEVSTPISMSLSKKLSFGKISPRGTDMDEDIYENPGLYPSDWVTYHTGGGLSNDEHTTFLAVRVYPVRYLPLEDEIQYINEITITITYREPDVPFVTGNSYDLLVLTSSHFSSYVQPLVNYKNSHGVRTKLAEIEQISTYGRDKAEQIKYYIKDAIENWGIKYVLIVGGIKGQSRTWLFPSRDSHVVPPDEQEYAEQSFLCDLYYADIYDSEGGFSSWDTNHNNIFAEWNENSKDEMDLYPDVYVGRLACRYQSEVTTMVEKIINYESGCSPSWFKKMVLIAGDSYNDNEGFIEGELAADEALKQMPGFSPVKVYSSNQDISRQTVNQALNPGAGFAYFCGHGSPMSWNTHPLGGSGWCTGYDVIDMLFLINYNKPPVVVVGGCHNARFDVTILNIINKANCDYGTWIPKCWAWWLTSKKIGGAIATIADTGLGTHGRGNTDNNNIPDYLEILDGWLEINFFKNYGKRNIKILGKNHGVTITEYMHHFLGSNEKMDTKMVQQWILFGDPSLKIGG